ncbi:hypothetical protein BS78_02G172800 [Paspalum vaginatum]|nr:hypothetical protein BS78_02G172800 [Paspalum vaginatum]
MQEPGWSSLPADLLETILELLPWSSHLRFAAVCKHWRSVVSPFYPAWITPLSRRLETPNAKICCTWGRQLTLCQREDNEITVVHTDLVTGVIYDLYPLEHTSFEFVVYNGQRRRMYGIEVIGLLYVGRAMQSDSGRWYDVDLEFSELSTDKPMMKAALMTNAVHHRGLLYLLGVDGRLAVHDDRRHEEVPVVLDNPKGFGFGCDDCYLFEFDEGELRAVLIGHRGTPVHILRLNEKQMEWEKVESLEGRALFTGTGATMTVKTNVKWMQNNIFVPRLYDWPESLQVHLVEREGELAFVLTSASKNLAQHSAMSGSGIWSCGLEPQESSEYWETVKLDYSVWIDFRN